MSRTWVVLGMIAGLALFVTFVWLPLERSRARLADQLPALRASIATLERSAEEAKRLRSMAPVAPGAAREPLASLVTAAGGRSLPGAEIRVLDGNDVRVTGADIAYGALLEWLAMVHGTQGLRVVSARIEALPIAGRVRADLRLSRS
jgi:general secretion pathway protein M